MKKILKYLLTFILINFLLIYKVNAVSKNCDYSMNINGSTFKYRVTVTVDDDLIEDDVKRISQKEKYWKNNVKVYYYNVKTNQYDLMGNSECSSANKYNITRGKICIMTTKNDKQDFFEAGINESSFSCPSMYQYSPNSAHQDAISISANKIKASGKDTSGKLNDTSDGSLEQYDLNISDESMTCEEILGPNLTKLVKFAINTMRIVGAIICIVNAMITLLPAVTAKDASALKKAGKKCVTLAIILATVCLFPSILKFIGHIAGFDLSCL